MKPALAPILLVVASALALGCDDSTRRNHAADTGADFRVGADTATGGDTRAADTPAGADLGDVGGDGTAGQDTAANQDTSSADTVPDTTECQEAGTVYTGTQVADVEGDPLHVGDKVLVTVEVMGTPAAGVSGTLELTLGNVRTHASTLERDGVPVTNAVVTDPRISIPLSSLEPAVFTFEGFPVSLTQLVTVFAAIKVDATGCAVRRSASGAMLQVVGGHSKTALCVEMTEVRSLQVAPEIALASTAEYLQLNGAREDLEARGFIFCPQSPTIVHATDFCLNTGAGQQLSMAGSYRADASWEVDDFVLLEAYGNGAFADGFTSQQHPGGDTFWCGETSENLCVSGCTAELWTTVDPRSIDPLAVASAVGADARHHVDGAVVLDGLLGTDGFSGFVRVTALDQGVEGTLGPALYLLSSD